MADALAEAERNAQVANAAKSRFLRQPLQTLTLLHGLLAKAVVGDQATDLVARLDRTLESMSSMLNTLLDINQIEAGVTRAEPINFPIDGLFNRLRDAFIFAAREKGLELRVVRCGLTVRSDPRLLEQMIRNLLSNAVKYTRRGKILLGCRRSQNLLSIQVWDTGIGIPADELETIFEEYRQLGNATREAGRGLGLGLSIVQRLGGLLQHSVNVHSRPDRGSVFDIAVPVVPVSTGTLPGPGRPIAHVEASRTQRHGAVLIVEDEGEIS